MPFKTPRMMFDTRFFYTEALLYVGESHVLRIVSIGYTLVVFGAFKGDFRCFGHRSFGVRDSQTHTSTFCLNQNYMTSTSAHKMSEETTKQRTNKPSLLVLWLFPRSHIQPLHSKENFQTNLSIVKMLLLVQIL